MDFDVLDILEVLSSENGELYMRMRMCASTKSIWQLYYSQHKLLFLYLFSLSFSLSIYIFIRSSNRYRCRHRRSLRHAFVCLKTTQTLMHTTTIERERGRERERASKPIFNNIKRQVHDREGKRERELLSRAKKKYEDKWTNIRI